LPADACRLPAEMATQRPTRRRTGRLVPARDGRSLNHAATLGPAVFVRPSGIV